MGRKFLRQIAVPEQAIAADGIAAFDLAVNPLSVVYLCLRPLNDTVTLANYARYRSIAAALNRVSILFNGTSILSMRGEDIAAMNWLRHGIGPWEANPDNVDNERRCVVVPLLLGKAAYDPESCFPATRRGELVLEADFDIADTGYDGLRFSVETLELLDARPKEYEKKVQISQTMVVGTNDIDLYAGNLCRGILLFGTTGFAGAAPAPTFGRVRVLLDNTEVGWAASDWEVAMMEPAMWGRTPWMSEHKHTLDATVAGITETTNVFDIDEDTTQYAFLNYDLDYMDTFSLDTSKATKFQIRNEAETADAGRIVQVEVIKV